MCSSLAFLQFFITLVPCPTLTGQYVVVGRVVAGKAVLSKVEKVDVDNNDMPLVPIKVFKSGECKGKDRMVDSSDDEEK
jgi:cyclophilin family peptidyl-prolyl cis-trans isomerase